MIHIEVEQGSDEWLEARRGIPTASQFARILTPKTLKPSAQAAGYMYELIAERATGQLVDSADTPWMQRGTEQEAEAIGWYQFNSGNRVQTVGFCTLDDRSAGCSPDGLVGEDGVIEVKCIGAGKHLMAVDRETDSDGYNCQVQGQLWITGRRWCDRVFYNGDERFPSAVVRVMRDDAFIEALRDAVCAFVVEMDDTMGRLVEKGLRCEDASKLATIGAELRRNIA